MKCKHTILVNNRFIFIMIFTDGDYMERSQIKRKEWLNPLRYEIIFRAPIGKWGKDLFTFNRDKKLGLKWANFNWKHGISCKVGIHFIPRGLWEHDGSCTKCHKKIVSAWNNRPL